MNTLSVSTTTATTNDTSILVLEKESSKSHPQWAKHCVHLAALGISCALAFGVGLTVGAVEDYRLDQQITFLMEAN